MNSDINKHTNALIHSQSPYLLQHAHNPVQWYEWGEIALNKAKEENKLLLISIGYSACHWCHVMAHESFEDEETAQMMNDYFICIKIDREELPDVDQIYMDACQLINGNGGWPLNAFALPDKQPIHALTYLPKDKWQNLIKQIHHLWQNEKEKAFEYAAKLSRGLKNMNLPPEISFKQAQSNLSELAFEAFDAIYDPIYGGNKRAPKFPLPNNILYLLKYGHIKNNPKSLEMGIHTLMQMSLGGIFDAVDGGFSRYSVDEKWFAPHFEKMLYDNAQLMPAFAYGFSLNNDPYLKNIALKTLAFCNQELRNENGLYYCALDADSEGVEGKFYTYTYEELKSNITENLPLFIAYFQCTENGNWEEHRNILYALATPKQAAIELGTTEETLVDCIEKGLLALKNLRQSRIKPGLDNKLICSWNALMLKGLAETAFYLEDPSIVQNAVQLYKAMVEQFYISGKLYRSYQTDKSNIAAYSEDYVSFIDALIHLYKITFDENVLKLANEMCLKTIELFYNPNKHFFRFSETQQQIIVDKYEINDDVINSSNSIMAHNLWTLSWYFDRSDWREMVTDMLSAMNTNIEKHAPWYSHWALLNLIKEEGMEQYIVSCAEQAEAISVLKLHKNEVNSLIACVNESTEIPLLKGKEYKNTKMMYHCKDQTCYKPQNIE